MVRPFPEKANPMIRSAAPSRMILPVLCTLALLGLAGCHKASQQPVGKAAGGEVLPGTISDAMIDVDRTQARPLLEPAHATGASAEDILGEDASTPAADSASAPDVAPTATATPHAEATAAPKKAEPEKAATKPTAAKAKSSSHPASAKAADD